MRITVVQGPFLPIPPLRAGAVEKIWFELGPAFARAGHRVVHVSRAFPGLPAQEQKLGVEHRRAGGADAPAAWRPLAGIDLLWPRRLLLDWAYCRRIRPLLPEADVLVSNTFFLPMLLPARGKHGALYVHCQRFPQAQYRWYRHAPRLQAVSTAVADRIVALFPSVAGQVRIIPNPVPEAFGWTDEVGLERHLAGERRRIVFVGRIHPQKGVDLLIAAFARFRQTTAGHGWKLRLVGPTEAAAGGGGEEYAAGLRRLTDPLGDAVEWAGFEVDPEALQEHYRAADIFVYPSVDAGGEASPVAPKEAMACGCAVLVSQLRCFSDYLQPGLNGEQFDHTSPRAAEELAAKLGTWADRPTLRREIARRGWATAHALRLPGVAQLYLEDFERIAAAPTA
ncbi:MAG: glycosyltransferase family 4 protein [Verrucomicrobia bacterium]|nr:glycosyltransferase family 4 protein [Verrucomicrobiota bacterium]